MISVFTACDFTEQDDSVPNLTNGRLTEKGRWTLMVYMAADNDLEPQVLSDTLEMVNGYTEHDDLTVILLVDRADSSVIGNTDEPGIFGENFSDTRMYRLTSEGVERISGGAEFPEITQTSVYEANTGDAQNLKKFIRSVKAQYPADKYGLILWNHGAGPRSIGSVDVRFDTRDIGFDSGSDEDSLFIGEISDVLGAEESVDFLGFDACLMGSVEIAYQFRRGSGDFSAHIMVASPDREWFKGWDYEAVFRRISST
ncbi:MAG: clostripain-related cysteine peptidase, partial [Spirochaetota bacterium]